MIKQELIGILEGLEGDSFIEKYNEGYDKAVRDCLIAVKQLDEPKNCIAQKADDFIKEGEGLGSDKVDIIDSAIFSQEQCQMMNFLCGLSRIEIYLLMH